MCVENTCGRLKIENGFVDTKNCIEVGTRATYNCFSGYKVVGNKQRVCMNSGMWTGVPASCISK